MAALAPHFPNAGNHEEVLRQLACSVLIIDPAGQVSFANDEARKMLGCGSTPGVTLPELLKLCGAASRADPDGEGFSTPGHIKLCDGRIIRAQARALVEGGVSITLEDVSLYMREAERARVDVLTNLSNRFAFEAALMHLLERKTPLAVFLLDLDRFKNVNDSLGHVIGDGLLRKVGERLASLKAPGDVIARLGGDEFIMLRPGLSDRQDMAALADRIVDLIGRTYALEGHMLNVGASVGITRAPDDGDTPDTLIKNADLALYTAKSEGRGRFCFFGAEMDARSRARRQIELDLRRALALKQFALVYQPQVDLATRAVIGFEALLRWHNGADVICPTAFIPVAEETGLIVPIGEWVLRTACTTAASWDSPASIAVNLSPVQFRNSRLISTVTSALASSGLAPSRLELEITEGALLDDTEAVVATLTSLRHLGVKVSMDDFGTGYSSLSYLQKFPFDKIKIDQSFVRDMQHNEEATAIVRAVARLGASLGIKTTAEGVETEEQLAAIRAEGCDQVQGYLTGRPMPSAEASALLAAGKASMQERMIG